MSDKETLYFLWTTGDPVTAQQMVFLYANSSLRKKRWEHVHLFVWGAATALLAESAAIQEEMRQFLTMGGEVSVCRRCAENIDKVQEMEAFESEGNFKVYYVGDFFTKVIKDGEKLITV